jgi:hypothetical protein
MNYQIRDRIARKTWAIWQQAQNTSVERAACPPEFYEMAQIAIEETKKEFDEIINNLIKYRLEKTLNQ